MENFGSEDFEKLLNEHEQGTGFYSKGSKVKGKIVKINNDYAFVDIGQKQEAAINAKEVEGLHEGDEIEAIFIGKRNKDGYLLLSRKPLVIKETLEKIKQAAENGQRIKGTIESKSNYGYIIDLGGVKGFLPASESGTKRGETLPEGLETEFYVIKFEDRKRNPNIVLSRKKIVEEEKEKEINKILDLLQEGQKVNAKVKKILEKGAVLSIDDLIFGYLPESFLSWKRNNDIKTLEEGSEIEVVIKDLDKESRKILFSIRDLEPNPWEVFPHAEGDVVEGTVKDFNDFGIILEVDGLEGFVHKSEALHINPNAYKKIFKVGDKVKAKIIELDKDKRRLKLSIKATEPHPVDKFLEENPEGSVVEGKVKDVKNKVAFIDLGDVEGVLRLQDATWNPRIKTMSEVLKNKKELKLKVLGRDKDHVVLGLKQFKEDPWKEFRKEHKVGDIIEVEINKMIERGAFAKINEDVEGFIPIREITKEKINIPSDKLSLHQKVNAKIIEIDDKNKKVILSIKAVEEDKEKKEIEEVIKKVKPKEGEGLGTLGEILKKKLQEKGEN